MRNAVFLLGLAVMLAVAGVDCRAVMVAPVVVDAHNVSDGSEFAVTLTNTKSYPQKVQLDWGWFALDIQGTVELSDSYDGKLRAGRYLEIDKNECYLPPFTDDKVIVSVKCPDFDSITPVLYVELCQADVHSRLAVLFVLSKGKQDNCLTVDVSSWDQQQLVLTVVNPSLCHSLFKAQIIAYKSDSAIGRSDISTRLLAASKRQIEVFLPEQADSIVVMSENLTTAQVEFRQ